MSRLAAQNHPGPQPIVPWLSYSTYSRSHSNPRLAVTRRTSLPYWAPLGRLMVSITPYLSTLDPKSRLETLLTVQFETCVPLGPFYRTGPQGKCSMGPGLRTRMFLNLTALTFIPDMQHHPHSNPVITNTPSTSFH